MKVDAIRILGKKSLSVDQIDVLAENDESLVKVTRGGICGSDIHYFQEGGIGDFKLQHPMVLGHEIIGYLPETKQKVAVNPSKACEYCEYCLSGNNNQCLNMEFFGSAMRVPHVHGGFAQFIKASNKQLVPYHNDVSDDVMAFAEPLSVAIHAINQAGGVLGKKVFITGCGPIGCLIIAACRAAGASEIIGTDLSPKCREKALEMGADKVVDPTDSNAIKVFKSQKGYFDVCFEASGAVAAFHDAIESVKAKGDLVLVGMRPGMVDFPLTQALVKEINIQGSFRFINEFETSVRWLEKGIIDPLPLLTKIFPYQQALEAFELAENKSIAMKVQLQFGE